MKNHPPKSRLITLLRTFALGIIFLAGTWNLLKGQSAQLSGQVLDATEQGPLGYASVAIFAELDSTQVGGILTDSLGKFTLSSLAAGDYYLELRFLGYEPSSVAIPALGTNEQRALGALSLQPTARLLEEIEITGRESQSFHRIDRQVYTAQQFDAARGGSVIDVLRNLPGVSVNGQGEISLRGNQGFLIMIDGRQFQGDPSNFLNQLPANGIENIEILTTPSAKYDPDGAAGIINITTRKGAADGLYLQVNGQLRVRSAP
ncbi:MAG: TonB-dependent receptor plug domain-containing protein [Bacteroidota bacterium]